MKNLALRSLTGTIYVALIVFGIITNEYTFLCLFSTITILCLWEFYGLMNGKKDLQICRWLHCLGGWILFISFFIYAKGIAGYWVFAGYSVYLISVFVSELFAKKPDPIAHIAHIFLGHLYIALPVALVNLIAFSPANITAATYHPTLVLAVFVFIWINDTGAYIVGSALGKHRLFERISPKKSWEGFFGGLIFTLASSLIFFQYEPVTPLYQWMGLSLVIVVFGTLGDLFESLIKRTLAVKDSGTAIPGHGGFLDRFDSFLLAAYAVVVYVLLIQSIQN